MPYVSQLSNPIKGNTRRVLWIRGSPSISSTSKPLTALRRGVIIPARTPAPPLDGLSESAAVGVVGLPAARSASAERQRAAAASPTGPSAAARAAAAEAGRRVLVGPEWAQFQRDAEARDLADAAEATVRPAAVLFRSAAALYNHYHDWHAS